MRNQFLVAALLFSMCHTLRADAVDDLIREEMAKRRIAGVALKIIQDGKEAKTATYGLANLELNVPVTTNSVFEIGSISKQFTASCILMLQQDGKLSIEDKISKHLADAPVAWSNVTIRHLLAHTSGIKSYTGLSGFELTRRLKQKAFLAEIGKQPMEFQPGERWKYSNTGYSLLGYIIENASGKSYWVFLGERILNPLGMTSTTDRNPGTLVTNRVSGYEQTNKMHINRDYDLTDVFSAGAIVSTIGDLAKWNAALDTDKILTEASKKEAWTIQKLNDGKPTRYGLGWYLETTNGHQFIGHGGSTSGFNASFQRLPENQLAVILLTNTDEGVATTIARKIAVAYLKDSKSTAAR